MSRISSIAPWLIAVFLLYFLFRYYPLNEVLVAASYVNFYAFSAYILLYFCYRAIVDSWSIQRTLNHFGIQAGLSSILELRLASYLPMTLNAGVGQGAMIYLIKRRYKEPLAKVSSILLYVLIVDVYWVLTFAFLGSLLVGPEVVEHALLWWIRAVWIGASLLLLGLFWFWRLPLTDARIKWIKARHLFHTLHKASLADYFRVMLWRLPLHCATSTYLYFLALCFGTTIPFNKVVTLLPLTIAVEAIPITPAGIGTVQITAILLFQNQVSGGPIASGQVTGAEIILAMSLLFTFAMYILKLIPGLIFWRKAIL